MPKSKAKDIPDPSIPASPLEPGRAVRVVSRASRYFGRSGVVDTPFHPARGDGAWVRFAERGTGSGVVDFPPCRAPFRRGELAFVGG